MLKEGTAALGIAATTAELDRNAPLIPAEQNARVRGAPTPRGGDPRWSAYWV